MNCCKSKGSGGTSSAVYGLGFVGAAVYYIQQAPNFTAGVIGFLKALVWPAFLVYEALKFLKM
ncbi:hypothetical protein M1307_03585 [Patescibacteria group bacterium]|nr:hypothetical protein [Patescibacteria group bacterium]